VADHRIETVSGGESNPVATNQTAQGRFESRRTELIVLSR
jgi:OOP family OmpA-OmpF porin